MDKEKKHPRRAIALGHEKGGQDTPKVMALGAGEIAERILELADKHGIPIHHDPDLVRVLAYLDVGEEIPPKVYRAVAEILVFIYQVNSQFKNELSSPYNG